MNKKATMLYWPILGGLVIGLMLSYLVDRAKAPAYDSAFIGQFQLDLLKSYSGESQKALYYLDKTAVYAALQAAYDLGQQGGLINATCGMYDSFPLWTNETHVCYPPARANLGHYLKTTVGEYLDESSYDFPVVYEFAVTPDSEVIGSPPQLLALSLRHVAAAGIDFGWPTREENPRTDKEFFISSCYGERGYICDVCSTFHKGIDIPMPYGTDVYAVLDGTIIKVDEDSECGKFVKIQHEEGLDTVYCHLTTQFYVEQGGLPPPIMIPGPFMEGRAVKKGDKIGEVGSTGGSTGNHLHLGVRVKDDLVDPLPYLANIDYEINRASMSCRTIGGSSMQNPTLYGVYPSFKVKLDYDINSYTQVEDQAAELISLCESSSDVKTCAEAALSSLDTPEYTWHIGECQTSIIAAVGEVLSGLFTEEEKRKVKFCVEHRSSYKLYE